MKSCLSKGFIILGCLMALVACESALFEQIEASVVAMQPRLELVVDGAKVTNSSYDFQERILNEAASVILVLRNSGGASFQLGSPCITIEAEPGSTGIFSYGPVSVDSIPPGGIVEVTIYFQPGAIQDYQATLTVNSSDMNQPQCFVSVSGKGHIPADGIFQINNNALYSNGLIVTLNMNFPTSPVQMAFSNSSEGLPGASWETYSATRSNWSLQDGADGNRTVYAKFRDSLGFEISKQDMISLDRDPPSGTVVVNSNAAYCNNRSVNLQLTASDALSGIHQMRFMDSATLVATPDFGSAAWQNYSTTHTYSLASSGDGQKYVYVQFRDTAGNISTGALYDSITLDTANPSGTLLINGGASYATNRSVSLALSGTDSGSGVSSMRLIEGASASKPSFGTTTWIAYSATHSFAIGTAGDGTKYIHLELRDAAGNVSSAAISDSIVLDTQDPVGSFTINSGAASTNHRTVRISTSGISGATQMRFTGSLGAAIDWKAISATQDVQLSAGEGTKTITGSFRDAAGNVFSLDKTIHLNVFSSAYTSSAYRGLLGTSIDISPDGTRVVAGMPYLSWNQPISGGFLMRTEVGGVAVWKKASGVWSGDGTLFHTGLNTARYGYSVSFGAENGSVLLVSAPYDGANTSEAYGRIFRYSAGGGTAGWPWTVQQTTTGTSSSRDIGETLFAVNTSYIYYRNNTSVLRLGGTSISSVSHGYPMRDLAGSKLGTVSERIAFGEPYANNSRGQVQVRDRLLSSGGTVSASDGADNNRFGMVVAVSPNASHMLVADAMRSVYIFENSGTTAIQRQKITPPGDAGSGFSEALAISDNGTTVVIGCASYNSWRGSVYIYALNQTSGAWELVQNYSPADAPVNYHFGQSVAINRLGTVIAVGAPTSSQNSEGAKVVVLE